MATLLIQPIVVTTIGGMQARITGIDPTNHDCLEGGILPINPLTRTQWNLNGIARDSHDDCNLDMRADELSDLARLARQLGAS